MEFNPDRILYEIHGDKYKEYIATRVAADVNAMVAEDAINRDSIISVLFDALLDSVCLWQLVLEDVRVETTRQEMTDRDVLMRIVESMVVHSRELLINRGAATEAFVEMVERLENEE